LHKFKRSDKYSQQSDIISDLDSLVNSHFYLDSYFDSAAERM